MEMFRTIMNGIRTKAKELNLAFQPETLKKAFDILKVTVHQQAVARQKTAKIDKRNRRRMSELRLSGYVAG
jgi:hypothetical protein